MNPQYFFLFFTKYMTSSELQFSLNVGIVNSIFKKGKKKKYFLLFMPHPKPLDFYEFYDQNGNGFDSYFQLRKTARNNRQKIAVVITIQPDGAALAHTEVMIDDLRGVVTVFDNSGTFGTHDVQKRLFERIKAMTQRRTGYSTIKRLPILCPRINESRPYCTYWSALFLQYILERPTKTLNDFVNYILKKHKTKSIAALKYYVDSMIPTLRKIGCHEAKRLVELDLINIPRECKTTITNVSFNMERLKL